MFQHSSMCYEVIAATDLIHVSLNAIDGDAVKRKELARFI
jgi:hypothetical protein